MDADIRHDMNYLRDVLRDNRSYSPIVFKNAEFRDLIIELMDIKKVLIERVNDLSAKKEEELDVKEVIRKIGVITQSLDELAGDLEEFKQETSEDTSAKDDVKPYRPSTEDLKLQVKLRDSVQA